MNLINISVVVLFISISGLSYSQKNELFINNDLQLIQLEDSTYVHVSWHTIEEFGRFPSNGMIFIKNGKALMIDTPMDIEKTEILVNYIEDSLNVEITVFVPGHYHNDCIGGLKHLHKIGVKSIANVQTVEKCKEYNFPIPKTAFKDSLYISFEGEPVDLRYFGGGHTIDNIIVFFPKKHILFGGCLIKSLNAQGLGNTNDAVITEWDITVEKIIETYPKTETVIPGHGNFGGKELLIHTIELVKTFKENE